VCIICELRSGSAAEQNPRAIGGLGGIFFSNCYNLTAYNATFYYDFAENPWYQSTLDGISADGLTWNITVGLCMSIEVANMT
jgi:hypothetical protein